MPEMTNLNWNQACRGENHKQLGPALLNVNADPFSKKNRRIKQRQKTSRPQPAVCKHRLQLVEQEGHRLAMLQQNFVGSPIRQGIDPASPRVQKKQRNTKHKQKHALADFEKRDQLEIPNTPGRRPK